MDFVGGGGGANGGLGSENGPILYSEPNRTSAIDDIRSVVIYIFIITIFLGFFLILPGIRTEKFPTFLCITTSLVVTSIILVALFGTSWHVGQAPISSAYKAFSRDRIQGDISVNIGLQSVNISLRAHKYYILHAIDGPVIMENSPNLGSKQAQESAPVAKLVETDTDNGGLPARGSSLATANGQTASNLADELLGGKTADSGTSVDTELEEEEVFEGSPLRDGLSRRRTRASLELSSPGEASQERVKKKRKKPATQERPQTARTSKERNFSLINNRQKYTTKRVNVDINYNERFYWIEPNQMRLEHHRALERGLPYPILTVVEYLSQDEAGFSWSRQYRLAGYYCNIILWLSFCVSLLMFFLHCAAPQYGIYTMQVLGSLLLFTNFTYATLVPRGEQKLVIPFEGQALSFKFGWNFWLVLVGGCLSLFVGTLIVIIDSLFPSFIFTTILDVDFDSHTTYCRNHRLKQQRADNNQEGRLNQAALERPVKPPFYIDSPTSTTNKTSSISESGQSSRSSEASSSIHDRSKPRQQVSKRLSPTGRQRAPEATPSSTASGRLRSSGEPAPAHLEELFHGPLSREKKPERSFRPSSVERDSEITKPNSSVVEILPATSVSHFGGIQTSDTKLHHRHQGQQARRGGLKQVRSRASSKNSDLKSVDERIVAGRHDGAAETQGHLHVRL